MLDYTDISANNFTFENKKIMISVTKNYFFTVRKLCVQVIVDSWLHWHGVSVVIDYADMWRHTVVDDYLMCA